MRKLLKNKKGFTLVEIIVVLVILAILAAIMIPAMTGWIDKANEKAAIAEARTVLLAAQTIASERYGEGTTVATGDVATYDDDILELAGCGDSITSWTITGKNQVSGIVVVVDDVTVTYDGTSFTCAD